MHSLEFALRENALNEVVWNPGIENVGPVLVNSQVCIGRCYQTDLLLNPFFFSFVIWAFEVLLRHELRVIMSLKMYGTIENFCTSA